MEKRSTSIKERRIRADEFTIKRVRGAWVFHVQCGVTKSKFVGVLLALLSLILGAIIELMRLRCG